MTDDTNSRPSYSSSNNGDLESGRFGADRGPQAMDNFNIEVDNVKEDIEHMERLYNVLLESNEMMKGANSAKILMELRTRANMNLDHILKLARQINKKFDGLILTKVAQRKTSVGNPDNSDDNQTRSSIISALGERLKEMMVKFQALRVRLETDHKQAIETRFTFITGQKATEEAIDRLVTNAELNNLSESIKAHGKGTILDAVAEIQERRDAMKETRKSLMSLHQILLGMATPMEKTPARAVPNPAVDLHATSASQTSVARANGLKKLNDYEKETRNLAYIAIAVSLVASLIIVSLFLKFDGKADEDVWNVANKKP